MHLCTEIVGLWVGKAQYSICSNPSFPSHAATPIYGACGVSGAGGAEENQNEAKNNFCASGTPEPMAIENLAKLQTTVTTTRESISATRTVL
jgi:hypothetical protein